MNFASIVQRCSDLLAETASDASAARAHRPWRVRLNAWWEGIDPEAAPVEVLSQVAASAPEQPDVLSPEAEWAQSRVALIEQLWGDDVMSPGGLNYFLEMVKPLGVNPAMHVLDLGAHLGGAARGVVERWGAWVVGLESSAELAVQGQKRSRARGLGGKAQIKHFDPETFTLRPNTFNCAYARETFFKVAAKERLFRAIAAALKSNGQLMFTDYVVTGRAPEAARAWLANEPVTPHAWTAERIVDCLQSAGFSLWFNDDLTEQHQGQILQGWHKLVRTLAPGSLPHNAVGPLVNEVELWARRIAAIEAGALKVHRFYGVKTT